MYSNRIDPKVYIRGRMLSNRSVFFAGANQYIENREKKKPLEVAKPQVARAILER